MKAKKCFAALALALLLSVSFMLAACGSRPDETAGSETPAQGGDTAAVYVLSASAAAADDTVTADVDYTVEHAPNVSFDSSNSGYTADSIRTDTFSFSYPADEPLDLYIEKGAVVEVTNGQKYTIGDTSTNTYTVTATAAGEYVFRLKQGDSLAAKFVYTVAEAYPDEPDYNPLSGYGTNNDLSVAYAHDPSVVEVDGMYYVFSTDNTGEFGYQVRQSSDMIRWEYVGSAIQGFGTGGDGVEENCLAGTSPLQEVYEIISRDHDWSYWGGGDNEGENWTLWAPDVVEGADGKYWLYGCWTADFGAGHSIIFLCKADSVTGPYTYDSIILYSYNGWTNGPNAIDP